MSTKLIIPCNSNNVPTEIKYVSHLEKIIHKFISPYKRQNEKFNKSICDTILSCILGSPAL